MLALDEKVVALERAFRDAGVPHAFGGAIALAYYATPRGTVDVDINLFVPVSELDRILALLAPLGVETASGDTGRRARRDEQVRIFWDHTPLDLFFSYDALHEACQERRREVPFAGERLTILSPEDLAVFKVIFDRDKDWRDLAEIRFAQAGSFDPDYVTGWLERILPADDPRLARFVALRDDGGID